MDDYGFRLKMLGMESIESHEADGFLKTFHMFSGDPSVNNYLRDLGRIPWWASSDIRLSYFRPLSAFSMWLDYQLWPNLPSLMHLHSLLLYGGLIILIAFFYRRIMGLSVMAGLAALFYAVDFSHATPVSWLANRNALLAIFFGVLCLIFYDRWRRDGKVLYGVLYPLSLTFALLSQEMALSIVAYLAAYVLFLDNEKWGKRIVPLWPCGLIVVLYVTVYRIFGFGANGSGFYIDPLGSPSLFLKEFMSRAPLLLMGQWSHLSADNVGITVSPQTAIIFAYILIIVLLFFLFPMLRKDNTARFFFMGMLLSLVPIAGVNAGNRNLLFVGIGAMGLMAQFIVRFRQKDMMLPLSRLWRIHAAVFIFYMIIVRLAISPLLTPLNSYGIRLVGDTYTYAARNIPVGEEVGSQDIVIVNPPDSLSYGFIRVIRLLDGMPLPASIKVLSTGAKVEVYRLDEKSLRVQTPGGLLKGMFGQFFRSLDNEPISANQQFAVSRMTALVTQVGENGPEEVIYSFPVPLEDPSLKWLQWKDRSYKPFIPPAVGQSVTLPPFDMRDLVLPIKDRKGRSPAPK
jgi:hypothetical protein